MIHLFKFFLWAAIIVVLWEFLDEENGHFDTPVLIKMFLIPLMLLLLCICSWEASRFIRTLLGL